MGNQNEGTQPAAAGGAEAKVLNVQSIGDGPAERRRGRGEKMQQDKEDDVALGAEKYEDRKALGTHAPILPSEDYLEPSVTPFLDGAEFWRWSF